MVSGMRVLLVSANVASSPYAVYPLGMSMVAGSLRNAGHEVQQFDFLHSDMSLDALAAAIKESAPGIIGISIRNIDNVNLLNEKRYIEVLGEHRGANTAGDGCPGGAGRLRLLDHAGSDPPRSGRRLRYRGRRRVIDGGVRRQCGTGRVSRRTMYQGVIVARGRRDSVLRTTIRG